MRLRAASIAVAFVATAACVDDLPVAPGDAGEPIDASIGSDASSSDAAPLDDAGYDAPSTCAPPSCVCDATTCPTGCCENGYCRVASASTCGARGGACTMCDLSNVIDGGTCSAAGTCVHGACTYGHVDADGDPVNGCESVTPLGIAETGNIVLWLDPDTWNATTGQWPNRATPGTFATAGTTAPSYVAGPRGHSVLRWSNTGTITDAVLVPIPALNQHYDKLGWSLVIVWRPATASTHTDDVLLSLGADTQVYDMRLVFGGGTSLKYAQFGQQGFDYGNVSAPNAWTDAWRVTTFVQAPTSGGDSLVTISDTTGANASLAMPLPYLQDDWRHHPWLGGSYVTQGHFAGDVAELAMFWGPLSPTSQAALQAYLKRKYGL